jgi:hypothetical protein
LNLIKGECFAIERTEVNPRPARVGIVSSVPALTTIRTSGRRAGKRSRDSHDHELFVFASCFAAALIPQPSSAAVLISRKITRSLTIDRTRLLDVTQDLVRYPLIG